VFRRPIEPTPEGDFRLSLSTGERELRRELPGELLALLADEPDDPTLRRLFPPAYEDDAEEAEYRQLMHGELVDGRRQALRVLETTADRERLGENELHAWLGALNDLRLALGTRLGVTEEVYERDLDPRDPQAYDLAVYAYLTWLQEHIVEATSEA
jgi:hypothetical protein